MYTLYYLSKNLQLDSIKVSSLDVPILCPEDLIFCNLREGINFIKEPHKCIDFTDLERLIIASEFTDTSLIKQGDYRKANSYLKPLCQIDVPLVLSEVQTNRALWNYPKAVLVLISNSEEGLFTPLINGNEQDSIFMNESPLMPNQTYWVMLKDVQKGIFSNKMLHLMPM
ncbi:hypothetical protein QWY99_10285 [Flavobacterium branchiarum]|uniref:Uncharacterized protein n=1 Tax=Flavobacterium branchiarum TaxID=1114870 RepID=A0ABV5FS00_9FLAO|nr:hypothetical protein [Flavobacterium branchiarum]MDN3673440.1 hypothetical protein [Flavobacterium branchiarum]